MAARLKPHHQDEIRTKIQTTKLVQHLEKVAFNTNKAADNMTTVRMKAIEILLRKTLPDLSNIVIEGGDDDKPVRVKVKFE